MITTLGICGATTTYMAMDAEYQNIMSKSFILNNFKNIRLTLMYLLIQIGKLMLDIFFLRKT